MISLSELDFVLINIVCFSSGVFLGLTICCKNKETFLQRVGSKEKIPEPIQCQEIKDLNLNIR